VSRQDPGLGPTHSALTLRLVLAVFGLVFCGVAAGITAGTGPAWLTVAFAVLAVVAVVDIVVVARRKRRGEPG
jgi:membrane protein implicated in regulation of membrane protease activity